MLKKYSAALLTQATVLILAHQPVLAQTGNGMPTQTPDGHPNISGTFTFRTLTPMQQHNADHTAERAKHAGSSSCSRSSDSPLAAPRRTPTAHPAQ